MLRFTADKVVVTEEGWTLKPVKDLYNTDRNEDKQWFNDVITYAYFVMNPESVYGNLEISRRKQMTCENQLDGRRKIKDFDKKNVKEFMEFYLQFAFPFVDKLLFKLMGEIEETLGRLSDIPWNKEKEITILVNIPDPENPEKTKEIEHKITKEIDYGDEKQQALVRTEKMITLLEKYQTKAKKQRKENSGRRLFDRKSI